MNRHRNGRKTVVFRIFSELHAKMSLGALCLCGFPGDSVEMVRARGRALTLPVFSLFSKFSSKVEMVRARGRALTHLLHLLPLGFLPVVEMVRARGRALTHFFIIYDWNWVVTVEMVRARGRALTHNVCYHIINLFVGRNGESPRKGIDTSSSSDSFFVLLCRNGESPRKGIDTFSLIMIPPCWSKVEMVRARGRALTQSQSIGCHLSAHVEMVRARGRALTQFTASVYSLRILAEMEKARFRALMHCINIIFKLFHW